MAYYVGPVANLINELHKLPGIGPKSAQRLAFSSCSSRWKKRGSWRSLYGSPRRSGIVPYAVI